ncbi:hypothetical protein TRIUR3_01757 [Triticum urartu]|uniref:TOD1/MUCI70 glycosyltransferase-like domain-containing protein n=1 Tax=Triticum urartu TaxID=4572 RepID=M8A1S8_TRIUA|nr:hypothetical protein TRIUR3_01757 [Triticum urartu]
MQRRWRLGGGGRRRDGEAEEAVGGGGGGGRRTGKMHRKMSRRRVGSRQNEEELGDEGMVAGGTKIGTSPSRSSARERDVPEGSFIVRAHTPMSNLFSCLWFNEANRFTSHDQLSFTYTYLKLRRMNAGRYFLNMF